MRVGSVFLHIYRAGSLQVVNSQALPMNEITSSLSFVAQCVSNDELGWTQALPSLDS